ncbi:hypothetical protein ACKS0A_11359 [Histoplasma ohiense]
MLMALVAATIRFTIMPLISTTSLTNAVIDDDHLSLIRVAAPLALVICNITVIATTTTMVGTGSGPASSRAFRFISNGGFWSGEMAAWSRRAGFASIPSYASSRTAAATSSVMGCICNSPLILLPHLLPSQLSCELLIARILLFQPLTGARTVK